MPGERTTVTSDSLLSAEGPAQRRAIAKAITLLESTRADHRAQADELLTALLPHTGQSFRLGISAESQERCRIASWLSGVIG